MNYRLSQTWWENDFLKQVFIKYLPQDRCLLELSYLILIELVLFRQRNLEVLSYLTEMQDLIPKFKSRSDSKTKTETPYKQTSGMMVQMCLEKSTVIKKLINQLNGLLESGKSSLKFYLYHM